MFRHITSAWYWYSSFNSHETHARRCAHTYYTYISAMHLNNAFNGNWKNKVCHNISASILRGKATKRTKINYFARIARESAEIKVCMRQPYAIILLSFFHRLFVRCSLFLIESCKKSSFQKSNPESKLKFKFFNCLI